MKLDSAKIALLVLAAAGVTAYALHARKSIRLDSASLPPVPPAPPPSFRSDIQPDVDKGLTPDEAEAVSIAAAMENDPKNLRSFAAALSPTFQVSAHLLATKASILEGS